MKRSRRKTTLTQQVLQTLATVGFVMAPLATGLAADAGAIQKVNGTEYLKPNEKLANIYADAVLGTGSNSVALNTFKTFKVDAGKIANMHFQKEGGTSANNLVNVVGSKVDINGIVNAVKDNKIGGNLYFLSNQGIAVGPTGVVNAGSVTMMTPTNKFYVEAGLASWTDQTAENGVNGAINLIGKDGNVDVSGLEKGFLVANWGNIQKLNIPLNKTGTITIEGKINTVDGINLLAGKDITVKSTASLTSKASVDYASLVNITDAGAAVDAGLSGDLVATKTGSGDITLAVAANTVNHNDESFADFAKNAEGYNTVKTTLTVEKGAVIDAVGNASLTTVSSVGSGQAGFFGTDLQAASADDLVGTMAKTVSEINIDGTVSGEQVAITADASNVYVNGSLSNFTNYAGTMLKSFIPLDSDLNYVVMDNQALVNIGADAVITARSTIKDAVTEENGYSLGGIELIPATENRDYALNIKANAYLEVGAGSAAAATKLSQRKTVPAGSDPGQFIPNAGVTYLEANNQANVVVAGKVDSAGDTNMNATASMYAEASAAADAPTRTTNQEVNNFVNMAAVVADLTNTATVNVTGADKTIGGALNVEANSDGQSYATSAIVGASETSMANTALNLTDVATKADITIDSALTANSFDIHADNSVSNSFTSNNTVGLSKRGARMASKKGGLFGGLLNRGKNGKTSGGLKVPEGLEKLGEFFSAGASIAVINETNASNVTVTKKAKLTAPNDINVTANTTLSGSYINVSGTTNNFNSKVNNQALISAAVLISDMDNSANVIIEGGDATKKAQLSGANVNIKANSQFLYDRPATIWGDFQQLCSDIQTAYQGDAAVIDAVTKVLGVSKDDGFAYMEDRSTEKAVAFFENVQNLVNTINASTVQANLDALTSLTSIPSALMAFIDGSNYANVNVFASTGGKTNTGSGSGGGTGSGSSGSSAKLAVAGTVNLSTLNNNAKVIVGKNTQLTAAKTLDVNATATQSDVTFNGKVKLFIPKTGSIGGADTAVGGNAGIYETNVNSLVVVGEGAELTGRTVDLSANNDVLHIVATFGGGAGGTTGVTGMASYMSGTSDSIVAVDDEAILKAKAATVDASDFAVADSATADEKAEAKAAYDKAVAENGAINLNATNKTNIQNIVFDKTAAGKSAVGASVGIVKYAINNIAGITDTDQGAVRTSSEVSNLSTLLATKLNTPARAVTYNLDNYSDYQDVNTSISYLNALKQSDIDAIQTAYEAATDETTKAGLLAQKNQMDYQLANKTLLVNRLQTEQAEMKSQDKAYADKYIAETESDLATLDKAYTDKTDAEYLAEKAYLDGKKAYLENLKTDASVVAVTPETPASGPDLTTHLGTTANKLTTGSVTAGDVTINAVTDGLIDNITVAGVTAGKSQKGGTKTGGFGLPLDIAASGSASVNMISGNSAALLEGANVDLVTTDATADTKQVAVTASDASIIGAYSGAAAVKKGGGAGGSSGFATTLAGAVAYNQTSTGVVAQIKDTSIDNAAAVNNTATKKGALVAAGLALGKQSGGTSGSGIAGGASVSYNDSTNTIHAVVDNTKVNKAADTTGASTTLNNIAYDKDIQIAGGITAQYAKANLGLGVAGSYLDVNNDVKALITGSNLAQMDTVKNYAATNLIQVGTAISVGIVSGQSSNGVQGAAAINNLTNNVNAELADTTISATQLEVKAFDGKLSVGEADNSHKSELLGTGGEGFDVAGVDAMADVNASNDGTKGGSDVSVADSNLGGSGGTTSDEAYKATTFTANDNAGNLIITGAVGTTLNNGSQGTVTAGAAVVYNNINNNFTSAIKNGSSITATGTDGIVVRSDSDTLLVGVAAGAAASKGQNGLAASGSASVQKLNAATTATVEDSTLTADKTNVEAESTSRLIDVAGQVSATKGNVAVGLTTADNILNNTTGAYVKGSTLAANNTATGSKVTVKATNDSKNYAIAVGVAASSNQTGAVLQGSMAMNSGANNTEAIVEKNADKYDETTGIGRSKITNAAGIDVTSADNTIMKAIAGSVSATQGSAAVGGAVAYNTITGQTNIAALNDTDVTTVENTGVNVKATDNSDLLTIAAGIALKSGQTGGAAEGSVAIADTTKSTTAAMDNTSINKAAAVAGVVADVEANSTNKITTSADVLAGTTSNVALGVGVAVNKSHNDTVAQVTGGTYKVQDLTVAATSSAKLVDIGIGVAATTGQGGSLAGNVAVNNIGNNTKAVLQERVIKDGNGNDVATNVDVTATGNVAVLANSTEHLKNYTGALSATVGSGYVAGGFSVAVNNINGETTAMVNGATLEAQGTGNGIEVLSYATDDDRNLTTTTKTLHGLIVNADAHHELDNVDVTGVTALSSEAGVAGGGTVSVNTLEGSTLAKLSNSDVNKSGAAAAADVNVLAKDNTEVDSHLGVTAVGIGMEGAGAAGAAADTNILKRSTKAQILGNSTTKNTVNANLLNAQAFDRQDVVTNAIGVAASGGMYGAGTIAGTISVSKNAAVTLAEISDIDSTNNGLNVTADHRNKLQLFGNSVALSGAIGSGSIGLGIGVVNDDSDTRANVINSTIKHNENGTAVDSVTALNDTYLLTEVADAAAAISLGGGASGSITVDNMDNMVMTTIQNSTVGTADKKAASFTAGANNSLSTKFATATGAGGLGAAAIGIGVTTVDTSVVTSVDNSRIYADSINLLASEDRDVTQYGAAGAISGVGLGTNVMITSIGSKVDTLIDYADYKDKDDKKLVELDMSQYLGTSGYVNTSAEKQSNLVTSDSTAGAVGNSGTQTGAINSLGSLYTEEGNTTTDTGTMWTDIGNNSGNASVNSGLTADSTKSGVTGKLGGSTTAQGVKVEVKNGSALTGSEAVLNANANTDADIEVYQGNFSVVGVSVSVGVLDVKRNSGVTLDNSTITADNITVSSNQSGTTKQNVYQGAIGGVNANVAYGRAGTSGSNQIDITNDSKLIGQGNVAVSTADTTDTNVHIYGVTAGAVNGGALIADASNTSTNTINVSDSTITNGVTYLNEADDGTVTDAAGTVYTTYELDAAGKPYLVADSTTRINATKNNSVTADVKAGTLGAASIYGMVSVANDDSAVTVNLAKASGTGFADGNNTFMGKTIDVLAENNPKVKAVQDSVAATLVGGIGVSVATAKAEGSAEMRSLGNTYWVDKADLGAQVGTQDGDYTAEAKALSVNASGVAAVQANAATATAAMTAGTDIGADTYKTVTVAELIDTTINDAGETVNTYKFTKQGKTDLAVTANNGTKLHANVEGITVGGIVASGTNLAFTENTTASNINLAGSDAKLKTLTVNGNGAGDSTAIAKGYGGGLVAYSPVAAESKNNSAANVTVNVSGDFTAVGDVLVTAMQGDKSNILADALTATVVGYSGTIGKNTMAGSTTINFTKAQLTTEGSLQANAVNTMTFGDTQEYAVKGSGYGGIVGAGATLDNTIDKTATINVKDGSTLASAGEQILEAGSTGSIVAKGVIKAAGAATVANIDVGNTITVNNKINVNDNSSLKTTAANSSLSLAASDNMNLTVGGVSDIQGAAVGGNAADVTSKYNRNNSINLNKGSLASKDNLNLYAGKDATGAVSRLEFVGEAEAYNHSGIAFGADPKLNNSIIQKNQINISNLSNGSSVADINMFADSGVEKIRETTITYTWLHSEGTSDYTSSNMGQKSTSVASDNFIKTDGTLTAGVQNKQNIVIGGDNNQVVVLNPTTLAAVRKVAGQEGAVGKDGIIISLTDGQGEALTNLTTADFTVGSFNYGAALYQRYQDLLKLINGYSDDKTSTAYLGYKAELARTEDKLRSMNLYTSDKYDSNGNLVQLGQVVGKVNVDYISLPDLVASGGNINIQTDNLSGSGTLEAKGSPEINITNNTNLYLKVNDITVGEAGGKVIYNDNILSNTGTTQTIGQQIASINDNHAITLTDVKMEEGSSGKINIKGNYGGAKISAQDYDINETTYAVDKTKVATYEMTPMADIEINGHIDSLKGEVNIESAHDDIIIQGDTAYTSAGIDAAKITLTAINGSVSQGYHDGITNIGGSVQTQYADLYNKTKTELDNYYGYATPKSITDVKTSTATVSATGGNTIAGDSIYINSADINVNGTLQSGYAKYAVDIDSTDTYTYEYTEKVPVYRNMWSLGGKRTILVGYNDVKKTKTVTVAERLAELQTTWENSGSKVLSDAVVTTGDAYKILNGGTDSSDSTIYNLPVYYNPSTGKLVLPDVDANGGKIYLTGRVSSTGGGTIKVLDGAYDIDVVSNVTNDVQVGKLLVNDISGLISITDANKNTVTEIRRDGTTYKNLDGTVTGTGASITSYTPEAGIRYNWTTGQDSVTTETYVKTVEKGMWGKRSLKNFTDLTDSELAQMDHDSATHADPTKVDKPNGEYVGAIGDNVVRVTPTYTAAYYALPESARETFVKLFNYGDKYVTYSKSYGLTDAEKAADFLVIYNNTMTDHSYTSSKEIAYWTSGVFGCHQWTKYQWQEITGTSQTYVGSVKADKPIAINFFGVTPDQSYVSVKAKGNINLTDNIGNKALYQITNTSGNANTIYGGLKLTSTAGSIEQTGGTLYGANATLSAKGAIDLNNITTGQLLTITAKTGATKAGLRGALMALPSSSSGNTSQDINLNVHSAYGAKGDVSVGSVGSTSTGVVTITADGNLIQTNDTDVITGQRINLASTNGTIGQTGKALKVYAGQTPTATDSLTASLNATAYGDINLEQTTGDMRIGTINSSNGDVTLTTSGSIVDALPYADKIDRGETDRLIQKWKDLNLVNDYGAEGNAGWTVNGLLYAIQDNIINPKAGVDTSTKAPNIIGKNITLNVGNSAGLNGSTITTIDLTTLGDADHLTELKTLAGADASTVTWDATAKKAYINEKLALGIESKEGNITVNSTGANGNVYLQGRVDSTDPNSAEHKNVNIAGIQAAGNVLVQSLGNITNTHTGTTAAITGQDVYLMAAGALGSADKAMTTAAKGAVLATAVNDIYLNQISNDPLQIKSMSSGKNIFVNAVGNIVGYIDPNATAGEALGYIRTENDGTLQLVSQTGSVGTTDAAVRIFNSNISDEDDRTKNGVTISAEEGGVNIIGVSTEIAANATPQGGLYLNTVTAKAGINVTDNGTVKVLGAVKNTASGSVDMTAQKDLTVGAQGSITNSGTGLSLTAGKINTTDATKNVVGNIALRGDVSNANGTTVLASKTGAISQAYDNTNTAATNAQLTAANLQASAVNGIDLGNKANVLAKVSLTNINNDVVLGNGGSTALDITLNHAVTGSINLHNYVSGAVNDMTVNGIVQAVKTIDAVNDEGKLTFTTNDVWASAESVDLHATDDVINNRIILVTGDGNNIDMTSDTGKVVNNKDVSADGGYVHMTAAETVENYGKVTTAKDVALVAGDGNLTNTGAIDAGQDLTMTAKNGSIENTASLTSQNGGVSLAATNGTITNNSSVTAKKAADFTATGDISLLGTANTIQGSAVSTAVTKEGNINVEAILKATDGDVSLTTPNGNITTANAITAKQNVTATTDKGNIELQKAVTVQSGSITAGTKDGKVTAADTLTAAQNVTAKTDKGNIELQKAVTAQSGSITAETKAGKVTAADTLTAAQNVTAKTDKGNVELQKAVTAQAGSIEGIALNGSVTADGSLSSGLDTHLKAVDAGTTDDPLLGNVTVNSSITSGRNTKLESVQGNISVAGSVVAQGTVAAGTTNGNIDFTATDGTVSGTSVQATVTGKGDITSKEALQATSGDVSLTTNDGKITTANVITAAQNVIASTDKGDIKVQKAVTAENGSIDIETKAGAITATDTLKAAQNVTAQTDNGDVNISGAVEGTNGNVNISTKAGNVVANSTVTAGDDANLKAQNNLTVNKAVTAGQNANLTTEQGNLEVNGSVTAQQGNANLQAGGEGAIHTQGNVVAGNDVNATTNNGNLTVDGSVTAQQGNANLQAGGEGAIHTQGSVVAGNNVNATTNNGNLTVNGSVTAQQGNANLQAGGEGAIHTQGNVVAGNDVNAITNNGNLTVDGSVTAQQGNANLQAGGEGAIHTQGNILAGNTVNANTDNGSLTVDGTITTQHGSINLQTNNETDPARGAINLNGAVLTETTGNTGDINIITNNGNVNYDSDITVTGTGVLKIKVGKGNITAGRTTQPDGTASGGKLQSLNGSVDVFTQQGDVDLYEVFAQNKASVGSQNGDVKIYKINGDIVVLQTKDMDNNLHVDETVAGSQIIVSSNRIGLDDIQQRPGKNNLLLMSVDSADPNEPVDQLSMNFSKVNKGIEFSQLWLNNGNIDVKEGQFFIDKLVVNNKALFSNKGMTTSVYGVPPVHDGSTSIYWNNVAATNPKNNLAGWHDTNYSGNWMNLFFGKDGRQQTSNGILLHLTDYNYVFEQRYTGEDFLSFLLDNKAQDTYRDRYAPDIAYYGRNYLYELSDNVVNSPIKQAPSAEIKIMQ